MAYIVCADAAEARRIGRTLIEERLAACCNLRPHTAIYRWQGAVEEAEAWGLLAKTTAAGFPALRARVAALHSHDCPCVLAVPIQDAHPAFAEWVAGEVSVPDG